MIDDTVPMEALLAHDRWLRRLAARLVASDDEAEDLVQETWLRAAGRSAEPLLSPRAWLAAVLRRTALLTARAEGRRREGLSRIEPRALAPAADESVQRLELSRVLVEEVLALPEPYRTVVTLRFDGGLSVRAIAQRVGAPVPTVKSRLARALALLRERLDRRAGGRESWLPALVAAAREAPALAPWALASKASLAGALGLLVVLGAWFLRSEGPTITSAGPTVGGSIAPPVVADARDTLPAEPEGGRAAVDRPVESKISARADQRLAPLGHGRVIDVGGRGLAGVEVGSEVAGGRSVLTGQDGWFEWELEERRELVVARDRAWATVLGAWVEDGRSDSVLVVAPSIELAGRVVDQHGEAVPRAHLRVVLMETWSRELSIDLDRGADRRWATVADDAGGFALRAPGAVSAYVHVSAGGDRGFHRLPAASRADLELEVWRGPRPVTGSRLTGRVLGAGGEPVADALVAVGEDDGRTDAQGTFVIHAPEAPPGTPLIAVHPDHGPAELLEPPGGWPDLVEVVLPAAVPLEIRGRVIDDRGRPVSDGLVWLRDPTPLGDEGMGEGSIEAVRGGSTWTALSGDGGFSFSGLSERSYAVSALAAGRRTRVDADAVWPGADLELRLPPPAPPRSVRGRCVGLDGSPLAGARVCLLCVVRPEAAIERGFSHGERTTDAAGAFEFRAVSGDVTRLYVSGPELIPRDFPLPPELPLDRLEVPIERRCHLQVVASERYPEADTFRVLDRDGNRLSLYRFSRIEGGAREGATISDQADVEDRRSGVHAVSERASTVVLLEWERELARTEVRLAPGRVTEVLVH